MPGIGTTGSMTLMAGWPNACAVGAIISLFNEGTNMPVGANSSYTKDMTPTLQQGIYLSICRI